MEQKWPGQNADATMIERQISPADLAPKKSNTAMIAGIAAAVVIVLAAAAFFVMRARQNATAPTVAVSTSGVTTTAPSSTAPMTAGQGVLLLSASPYGELEKIVDDKGKLIDLSDEKRSTPTRVELAPGKYMVTLSGPNGSTKTVDVNVEAGKPVRRAVDLETVNYEDLEKEVGKQ
jgi:hypothetical protein